MKKLFQVMTLMVSMLLCTLIVNAQNARTYKFWTSTSGACPIKVVVNGHTYSLNSGSSKFTLSFTKAPSIQAYDKYGDPMRISTQGVYDGSRTYIEYVSVNIGDNHWQHVSHNNTSSDSSSSSSSSKSSIKETTESASSDNRSSTASDGWESTGRELGHAMGDFLSDTFKPSGYDSDGYPCFQITGGVSRVYGEFARLKWCAGSDAGFALYGGIGRDWFFDGRNHGLWHLGMGAYMSPEGDMDDVTIGLTYSDNAISKETLTFDVTYSIFFGRNYRFGVFAGGGIGYGNLGDLKVDGNDHIINKDVAKFVWDLNIGIAYKLF